MSESPAAAVDAPQPEVMRHLQPCHTRYRVFTRLGDIGSWMTVPVTLAAGPPATRTRSPASPGRARCSPVWPARARACASQLGKDHMSSPGPLSVVKWAVSRPAESGRPGRHIGVLTFALTVET